ncbi:unnamed protein product [Brassicogethes aeneus]|uniref:Cupin-like domain-containing protein n=1 Tax=Brassicogethes aeneus TaxID=1431903 RepID=A0A9P0FJ01_BRAAE|nr:unnamed protein product [Brassicogethes aeneus]
MEKAEDRLKTILEKWKATKAGDAQFSKLDVFVKLQKPSVCSKSFVLFGLVLVGFSILVWYKLEAILNKECLLEVPGSVLRPPEYCEICRNVTTIDKVENISPESFYYDYVKPCKPVIVKDGALGWEAMKLFSFDFFKHVYESLPEKRTNTRCQFFPYQTEFRSLKEVFNMSSARAKLEPGEKNWYIGFNNCNDEAGQILKQYYETPYFLSPNLENIALSWIFMGGPGHGAQMHVDNVIYPSWQAQLSGRKKWILAPPPECYYKCKEISVIVEPGEIIALNTNRWYHQTFVQPGEISITIGSEFF